MWRKYDSPDNIMSPLDREKPQPSFKAVDGLRKTRMMEESRQTAGLATKIGVQRIWGRTIE
tara:strand:- start:272 stop:454 length:183 start_codon:yes stop_codon:yes gene_type:complete